MGKKDLERKLLHDCYKIVVARVKLPNSKKKSNENEMG